MFSPVVVLAGSFQQAWKEATLQLSRRGWRTRNLVVHIEDPVACDDVFHSEVTSFASDHGLLSPKQVAYTIFPHGLYDGSGTYAELFDAYNRPGGMRERVHRRARRWGTYFGRMTCYGRGEDKTNQLSDIIEAINSRAAVHTSAYTVTIPYPGTDCARVMGGPCLNHVAIQLEKQGDEKVLGLLATYRNHDFVRRAYGNYWGLCNLCRFLATETDAKAGPITCISSNAYVGELKTDLSSLLELLP